MGSKKHIIEMQLQKKKRPCLLMPDDKVKALWTIVIVLLMLYTAIFVPF